MTKQHNAVRKQLEEDVEKLQAALQEVCIIIYAATILLTIGKPESFLEIHVCAHFFFSLRPV